MDHPLHIHSSIWWYCNSSGSDRRQPLRIVSLFSTFQNHERPHLSDLEDSTFIFLAVSFPYIPPVMQKPLGHSRKKLASSVMDHHNLCCKSKLLPNASQSMPPLPRTKVEAYFSTCFKQTLRSFPGIEDKACVQDPQALKQHHAHLKRISVSFFLHTMHATGHWTFFPLRISLCD
jgi:hypothetical protein